MHNGRVYTFGATGIVNALDAGNGAVMWSRNAGTDTGAKVPAWGFASSPLVVKDVVIVAASGRLVAYDLVTGNPRWVRQTGGGGYSSPHLATIDGLTQLLLLSGAGATGVAPADGSVLWQHSWMEGVSIVQPAVAADGDRPDRRRRHNGRRGHTPPRCRAKGPPDGPSKSGGHRAG